MTPYNSMELTSPTPKTAKSAILHVLSQRFPLTAKQLANILTREYGMEITYQAVHKALKELEKNKNIHRNERLWKLDPLWLLQQDQLIQNTLQKYKGNKNRYNIDLNYDGLQFFEFDNFTDMCVESAKLVANEILSKDRETAYWILEYGWWPFKFKFEHLELLYKLMSSSPKSSHIIRKITPFGKWAQKQYERVGGIGAIGKNIPVEDDILIQGDWIVQIHISDEGKKLIQKLWKRWKNLEDCFMEFGLKKEPKMEIYVKVTRNQELANFMKKEFEIRLWDHQEFNNLKK